MASEPLHTLRFKHGSAEFELTSTADEVAGARAALSEAILAAFTNAEPEGDEGGNGSSTAPKRKTSGRRQTKPKGPASEGSGNTKGPWTRSSLRLSDGFPDIGKQPEARWAAYAVLSWAHKVLEIDGLSAQDIQKFMAARWRMKLLLPGLCRSIGSAAAR